MNRTPTAVEIDDRLHGERVGSDRAKVRCAADLDDLPDGVFVCLQGNDATAYLVWRDELLAWSAGGYHERRPRPAGARVSVLTPASTVAAIRAGYTPAIRTPASQPEIVAPAATSGYNRLAYLLTIRRRKPASERCP